ncbi:MAG TPA: hypothetical protein VGP63_17770 [Planctomycetaceae bacterium]|nr:hypothetical protein [Planctomycetaceae bacterium]
MTSRLLIRVVFGAIVAAGVAYGIAWFYFGEPSPDFEFEYAGNQVIDLRFSPDGQKLAIVGFELPPPESERAQVTRVVRVSDGGVNHALVGAWKCDWSPNGSLFATASVNGTDFDVWETTKWRLKNHLSLLKPAAQNADSDSLADTKAPTPGIVQRLCFNRDGSLFTVSFAQDENSKSDLNHAKIWADPLAASAAAESIGSCGGAWDFAVAGSGKSSFVALFYKSSCSPEVLKFSLQSGKVKVEDKVALKDLPHELSAPRIALTPDGSMLLMRDTESLDFFDLSSGSPRLVHSIKAHAPIVRGSLLSYKQVEISRDGRFVAFDTEGHVNVLRLPDGKPVLTITHYPTPLALSPDGSLLALADRGRHGILFYRIPGGGSGNEDAGSPPSAQQ